MHLKIALVSLLAIAGVLHAQTTKPSLEPTRITLKLTDATIEQSIAAFASASGVAMSLNHLEKDASRITLDYTEAPMLDVLADLMRQGKVAPLNAGNTHSISFIVSECVMITRPDPTTLIAVRMLRSEGTAPVKGSKAPRQYSYNMTFNAMFDPARQIVCIGERAMVDDVASSDPEFRKSPDGQAWMQRVDCRPIGVFEFNVGISSDQRIDRFDKLSLRLKAWQVAERKVVEMSGIGIVQGASVEQDGLVLTTVAPSPDGTLKVTVAGDATKLYGSPPWSNAIASMVRLDGINGPVGDMRCNYIDRGKSPELEIHLGGPDRANRPRPFVQPLVDDIETIRLSMPTKVRALDLPIELINIPLR